MIKKFLALLILFSLCACNTEVNDIQSSEENTSGISSMDCNKLKDNLFYPASIYRCENEEVLCYIYSAFYKAGGLSCKFKHETKEEVNE